MRARAPWGFGWDKVITSAITFMGGAVAVWTGYLAVFIVVLVAYFAGGTSFAAYLDQEGDDA